jgi:hypothetical protein
VAHVRLDSSVALSLGAIIIKLKTFSLPRVDCKPAIAAVLAAHDSAARDRSGRRSDSAVDVRELLTPIAATPKHCRDAVVDVDIGSVRPPGGSPSARARGRRLQLPLLAGGSTSPKPSVSGPLRTPATFKRRTSYPRHEILDRMRVNACQAVRDSGPSAGPRRHERRALNDDVAAVKEAEFATGMLLPCGGDSKACPVSHRPDQIAGEAGEPSRRDRDRRRYGREVADNMPPSGRSRRPLEQTRVPVTNDRHERRIRAVLADTSI